MGTWFLTQESYKGGRKLSEDEPVGSPYVTLTHDCPFCGKRGSKDRGLLWIVKSCIESGKALFPCCECREYITFPSEVFKEGLLESLRITEPAGGVGVHHGRLGEKTPKEIFVKDWFEVLLTANKGGPVDLGHIAWDGKGTCPGCGRSHPERFDLRLTCLWCNSDFWINENLISNTDNTKMPCPKCNREIAIPPTVWCQVCGNNVRSSGVVMKLVEEATHREARRASKLADAGISRKQLSASEMGSIFDEAAKDTEFLNVIAKYKKKITVDSYLKLSRAIFEIVVEGKDEKAALAKSCELIVKELEPFGTLTYLELRDLVRSLLSLFQRYRELSEGTQMASKFSRGVVLGPRCPECSCDQIAKRFFGKKNKLASLACIALAIFWFACSYREMQPEGAITVTVIALWVFAVSSLIYGATGLLGRYKCGGCGNFYR